jgi:hypothetical protein
MDPTDVFFTQAIVGAPVTVMMGHRSGTDHTNSQGLEVNLATGENRLSRMWNDWLVLSHADDAPGTTRKRPGLLRRKMERHALWLAILGLFSMAMTAAYWGIMQWS